MDSSYLLICMRDEVLEETCRLFVVVLVGDAMNEYIWMDGERKRERESLCYLLILEFNSDDDDDK